MTPLLSLIFPLTGFLFITAFNTRLPKSVAGTFATLMTVASFITLACITGSQPAHVQHIGTWFHLGNITTNWSLLKDSLSSLMGLIITGVGGLIHLYSLNYMKEDPRFSRFFAYLNLFIFFMLILVLSNSFAGMFIGWEGVGLCSYLLIGFWHQKAAYAQAAKKAFVMNRIGDLGFIFALLSMWATWGTTEFSTVLSQFHELSPFALLSITFGLLVGAMGKSAQFPLLTWLPDAMAGPTPVSALIHAATMVTAGVYMIVRSYPIFLISPLTMTIITTLGIITATAGALIALAQQDIKKILAYSTISQLGFMFIGLGIGAPSAALFHMTTHAFFKALLFLSAGSVIYALHHEQNIFKMGNLRKTLPFTHLMFLIGTLAICGCPPLSGFFSKDALLLSAATASPLIFTALCGLSILTAVYMFRLYFLVFWGSERSERTLTSPPLLMKITLGSLALLSLLGGLVPIPAIPSIHHAPLETPLLIVTLLLLPLIIALCAKRYTLPIQIESSPKILSQKLYLDEIYAFLIITPYFYLCKLINLYLEPAIDTLTEGLCRVVLKSGLALQKIQSGKTSLYIILMLAGILALIGVTFLS